jgi:predicted RND superfamily exporter protein
MLAKKGFYRMKKQKFPERLAWFGVRFRAAILVAAGLLAIGSIVAAGRIRLVTELKDLLPEDNLHARSYTEILDTFETTSSLLVTIEGTDRRAMIKAAEELAAAVRRDPNLDPLIRNVVLSVDRGFMEEWVLLLMDRAALEENLPIFAIPGITGMVAALNDELESSLSDGTAEQELVSRSDEEELVSFLDRLEIFTTDLTDGLVSSEPAETVGDRLASDLLFGEPYTFDPEGRMLMFVVTPSFSLMERDKLIGLTDGVRGHQATLVEAYPGLRFGIAGDIASEADEERAMSADLLYPSILAVAVILVLFTFSFSRFRAVVFALVSLVLGILYAVGISAFAIGEFNMITSGFGALLVGLGIDFGIHSITRFDRERRAGKSAGDATAAAVCATFIPVTIGAVTTALAFFTLMISQSKGFRQFGFVTGTGIITTLASMYLVLPALLASFPGKVDAGKRTPLRFVFLERMVLTARKHRIPVLICCVVVTVVTAFLIPLNRFEYDMRKIGPQNTLARATENRILERLDLSPYPSVIALRDPDEVESLTERLRDHPMVRNVESVSLIVPSPELQQERLDVIRAFAETYFRTADAENDGLELGSEEVAALADEIQRLEWNVIETADLSVASLGERNMVLRKRNAMIREIFGSERGAPGREVFSTLISHLSAGGLETAERFSAIDSAFTRSMRRYLDRLLSVARPVTVDDLPPDIRQSLVSPDGTQYLITVYPDGRAAGEDYLLAYHDEMSAIHAGITGALQLAVELSKELFAESRTVLMYVSIVVLILLFASFRNLRDTLFACASLAVAMVWMLGIYPLFGKFNVINILALPLIVGIGIDYGVHFIHGLRTNPDIVEVIRTTGRSVLLSALTTLIGFGSLVLIGSFEGIASLGLVLFIGIACSLVAAMVVLPALVGVTGVSAPERRGEVSGEIR